MNHNIEPKYNYQLFMIVFFITFIIWTIAFYLISPEFGGSSIGMLMLLSSGL